MKSQSLAILLCFFISACSNSNDFTKGENNDSIDTQSVNNSTKSVPEATPANPASASINFPFLVTTADSLRNLLRDVHFKRIVFNHYPEQSGQLTMMRLVAVKLKANRDTLGHPSFDLLSILPNIGGKYPPLPLPKRMYFSQYELTDNQITQILNQVSGNPNIILTPRGPNSYTVGYELSCTNCITNLGFLPPCPPYRPE